MSLQKNPSLYIHIPFCASKCPYCAFYSESGSDALVPAYLNACLRELEWYSGIRWDTVYVGGGTPSHIGGSVLADFLGRVERTESCREFTVEINPESAEDDFFHAMRDLNVSRYSLGVESTDDNVLKILGRPHNAAQGRKAFERARRSDRAVNTDIIYDIPGVSEAVIMESLQTLISWEPDHISAYSYSPDTSYLTDRASDEPEQMLRVMEILAKHGYAQYEVSNFARAGQASIHNMKYWSLGEYVGIGAGAHSMILSGDGSSRWHHGRDIKTYMENPLLKEEKEFFPVNDLLREGMVFGLRMVHGVDVEALEARFGDMPPEMQQKIDILIKENMLEWNGLHLKTTQKGLLLLDSVMSFLW